MSRKPEAKAREVIDAKLAASGWLVQDRAAMNRSAGLGIAVREYSLATGPCDYLLLIAGKACGVIEAKAAGATLSGVAEQARGYQSAPPAALARWNDPLRFDYEASGTEIQFSDRSDPEQRSRRVFGFHRPETLHVWLKTASSLRARLPKMPGLVTDRLRDCQVAALNKARIESFAMPVPSVAEQHEIVARIEFAQTAWDGDLLNGDMASDLRQSILAAAFRGALVA